MERIQQYRIGRNYIRVGDRVRVKPSRPGKRDGGEARVMEILQEQGAETPVFHVLMEGRNRWFRLDQIERMAQTRHGEKVLVR